MVVHIRLEEVVWVIAVEDERAARAKGGALLEAVAACTED